MTRPEVRPRPFGRAGRTVRRALTGLLVAFSGALLLRPVLLLVAAFGPDGDASPIAALVATGFHLFIFVLAITLFRRTR